LRLIFAALSGFFWPILYGATYRLAKQFALAFGRIARRLGNQI
jgi:hypothetical protein